MKLNASRLLTNFYATLTAGLVVFALLAYIHPLRQVWSMQAFLCFLIIIFVFTLDIATNRWKRR